MTDEWEARYAEKKEKAELLKNKLSIRIFGPYAGDCSYILSSAADRIAREEGYDTRTCLSVPDIKPLSDMEKGPVYNWEASLECITRGMAGVFVFMKAKDHRFGDWGPFVNASNYSQNNHIYQELNSSVILEFSEWVEQSPRNDDLLIIYEDDMEDILGSLILGRIQAGEIATRQITTSGWGDTVDSITNAICGQCQTWMAKFKPILQSRLDD